MKDHALDHAAPALHVLKQADKDYDAAQDAVRGYVAEAFKGTGYQVSAIVWRSRISLEGFGKVWKDQLGRRTCKRAHLDFGDWVELDRLIAEAKAHYAVLRERRRA